LSRLALGGLSPTFKMGSLSGTLISTIVLLALAPLSFVAVRVKLVVLATLTSLLLLSPVTVPTPPSISSLLAPVTSQESVMVPGFWLVSGLALKTVMTGFSVAAVGVLVHAAIMAARPSVANAVIFIFDPRRSIE
jgi:hypothetical protein